ncbi:MAG: rod shape-determining protein MreC [Hylemonella sp.]|nr:rod shape-determining protein MreC [Hylemonella sp.]MDH5708990.1 rod shape-determining protein MreC [Hylemonella sp.]
MHLGTLERATPSFFRQGPSALSRLLVFGALSIFLMVADTRFHIVQPLRLTVASILYPLQMAVVQPVNWVRNGAQYFASLQAAQQAEALARGELGLQALRAAQVEQLTLENERLRQLLSLRESFKTKGLAAQVLYDAADPYTRKIVIDRGALHGVVAGAPVLDERGVLGQVTQIYPSLSEVTLLSDPDQAIPVLNTRSGLRAVAFGEQGANAGLLELRYLPANSDIKAGDMLTTSGVDGVYPAGLPVARVEKVERRADSAFAIIFCSPVANVTGALHVLVLDPVTDQLPAIPKQDASLARTGSKS